MRPVRYSDVSALTATLLAAPKEARSDVCAQVLREVDLADRYVRALGTLHPLWGNGTLSSAAAKHPQNTSGCFDDAEFCACFEMVLAHLKLRPRAMHL